VKALIDTHVLLWALGEPDRIPRATRELVLDGSLEIYVSAASAWEISIKQKSGKLIGAEGLVLGYPEQLERLRAREVAVTGRHGIVAGQLGWAHRDPFDRMIVAQAMLESLPIITADQVLAGFDGVRTIWG
jgi:PIN domain nuclease of toxin-antitoxin system